MKLEFFQKKFWTASRQNINCYLIDNNGFVLVAEDYTLTGKFFGEAEGAVMSKLLQMGSFKRVTLYDYQALCWVYSESSDSGHTLLDPYFAFFSAVKWILTELVIFLVEFNLYSWWHSDLTAKAQRIGRTMQVPCDTEYPAFVSERTIKENTGNIDCDGCIKSFVIQQIPSSNLFMVVVDNKSAHNESLKCERLKMQKDRRRPDTCHPFHPEENSMECGGAVSLTPSFAATLLCILLRSTISNNREVLRDPVIVGRRPLGCGLHVNTKVPVVNSGTCFVSLSFPTSQAASSPNPHFVLH
eukprot:superscaffoldBa00000746_g6956